MIQEKVQKRMRSLFKRIAKVVERNHLFEQPGERTAQPPIFVDKCDDAIQLLDCSEIEEKVLQARVVNHWATWCAPCVEELDVLASIQSHIGPDKILGINWDLFQGGSFEEARTEILEHTTPIGLKYKHAVVSDQPEAFFAHFDLEEQLVPQTMVYSPSFEVLFHRVGVLTEEDISTIVGLVKG